MDSFDSLTSGVPNFISVAFALMDAGYEKDFGVRIDSGDLAEISINARKIINEAGVKANKDTSEF